MELDASRIINIVVVVAIFAALLGTIISSMVTGLTTTGIGSFTGTESLGRIIPLVVVAAVVIAIAGLGARALMKGRA